MKYQQNIILKGLLLFAVLFAFTTIVYADPEDPVTTPTFNSVSLSEDKIYLEKEHSVTLTPVIDEEGASVNLIWSSGDEDIATVDNGEVTGIASGTTTITVANEPEVDGAVNVDSLTVRVYDSYVDLDTYNATITGNYSVNTGRIYAGHGGTLSVDVESRDITELTTSTSDEHITATLNGNTLNVSVGAQISAGEYTVTVTGKFKKDEGENDLLKTISASIVFNVYDVVAVTGLTTGDTYVDNGTEVDLNYTILPTTATNKDISYSFNTYSKVLELRDGKLMAKKRGTENVTVQSIENPNATGVTNVIVVDASIDSSSKVLRGTYDFNNNAIYTGYTGTITFDSVDVNDVDVSVKKGLSDITSGFTASVTNNVITVSIGNDVPAGNYDITVIGKYVNDNRVVSSDEVTFEIEVINNVLIEEIIGNDMIIPINYNDGLDFTISPNTATNQSVSYQVNDESVLTIENGKVNAKKLGTTSVVISTLDGSNVTKTINVTVAEPSLSYGISSIVGDPDTSLDTLYTMYEAKIVGDIESTLINNYEVHVLLNGNVDADAYFHLTTVGNTFTLTADKTLTVDGTYTIVVTGEDVNGEEITGSSNNNTFVINEVLPVTGVNASDMAIELLDEVSVPYTVTPAGASNYNVLMEIVSGDDVISILDNGKVKGLKKGTASLKISSKENPSINKTITIDVKKAEIELYNESISGNYNINTNVIYESYGGTFVTYYNESDVNDVVLQAFDGDNNDISSLFTYNFDAIVVPGNASMVKRLTATVPSSLTAGTYSVGLVGKYVDDNGRVASRASDFYDLTILEDVRISSITGNDMYIPLDYDGKINYTITPNDVVNDGVVFQGYDETIISVAADGTITPHKLGETIVTVKAKDKGQVTGNVKVIVTEPSFTFDITSVEGDYYLNTNAIYQYQAGTITGTINPILTSDFTVSVSYANGLDASALFDFNVDQDNLTFTVSVDETKSLAQNYVIKITGKDKDGNTIIGTSSHNTFTILNNTLVSSIQADNITMLVDTTADVTYTVSQDALNKDVDITIKDGSDIISLDQNRIVTGLESGTAHISIKAKDASKVEKIISVKVVEAQADITIDSIVGHYDLDTTKIYEYNTGTVNGSVECVDVNDASIKVYKDNYLVENGFDITLNKVGDNYSFAIDVADTVSAGTYTIVFEGSYLYNGNSLSGVRKTVTFNVESNVLIDDVFASNLYIKVGENKQLVLGDNYLIEPANPTSSRLDFNVPSDYSGIIEVSDSGVVTGISEGTARLELITHDSGIVKKTINVYVNSLNVSLTFEEVGNADALLGTDKIYEYVGGMLKLYPTVSDTEALISYKVYDLDDDDITSYFEFGSEETYDYMNVSSDVEAGIYKIVVTATDATDNTIVSKDYKYFTIYNNVLVNDIVVDDLILPLDTCYDLINNIVVSSGMDGIDVTNSNLDIIIDDESIVSFDISTGQLTTLDVGETSLTLKAKDAGKFEKTINVMVVDVTISDVETEISGNYVADISKIFYEYGGIIYGTFDFSACDDADVILLKDGNVVDSDYYSSNIDIDNEYNIGEFYFDISNELEAGEYQIKIILSCEVSGSNVSNYALIDFEIFSTIPVTSITSSDMIISLSSDNSYIDYEIAPNNATFKEVYFNVKNNSILRVDEDGLITPLKAGETNVVIESADGNCEKSINVKVVDANVDFVSASYFDYNDNRLDNIYAGSNTVIAGAYDLSEDLELSYKVYKDEQLVTDDFSDIYFFDSSFELLVNSEVSAGNYKLVVTGCYRGYDNSIVDEDSFEYEFTVLDPSKITSLTLLSSVLRDGGNDAVELLHQGESGVLNASYRLVNGSISEVLVYKGTQNVTSQFTNITSTNNSLSLSVPSTLGVGDYNVIVKATLVENDNVISSAQIEIPFEIDEAVELPEIEAVNMSIKMGDTAKINYQPSSMNVSYIVNDSTIISVDSNGYVTPKKVGQTSVTIKSVANPNVTKTIVIIVFDDKIVDTGYTIDDAYISDISANTDLSTFISNITRNNSVQVKVYSKGSLKTSGLIATGDTVEIISGNVTKSYKAVVPGDTSGDGKINYLDYVNVYNHIQKVKHPESNKSLLVNEFLLAADLSGDNNISYLDYVRIYNRIKELKGGNN